MQTKITIDIFIQRQFFCSNTVCECLQMCINMSVGIIKLGSCFMFSLCSHTILWASFNVIKQSSVVLKYSQLCVCYLFYIKLYLPFSWGVGGVQIVVLVIKIFKLFFFLTLYKFSVKENVLTSIKCYILQMWDKSEICFSYFITMSYPLSCKYLVCFYHVSRNVVRSGRNG